ncbi:MAG TPA: hypothetical protein DCY79_20775, partial [Planctomycetaceae bacterium]|nr:hypothetical protein [Planctomycetaceae bacterium]
MAISTLTLMRFLGSRAVFTATVTAFLLLPFAAYADKYDDQLRALLDEQGIYVPDSGLPAEPDADMILLGQALFFDHELSGNRDIACATCHHPTLATGDAMSLSIGTGAANRGALGPLRQRGLGRRLIPRNAPEVFNRGSTLWRTQYWDSRVAFNNNELAPHPISSPAPIALPSVITNVLAAQAMFPVTSRDEMRGAVSDGNELAIIDDDDFQGIWDTLADRLLAIPGYRQMFSDAYGIDDADLDDTIGFGHAANAIATFEAEAFTFLDSPFDRYLEGNSKALSKSEKKGALLFFGQANCSQCHAGPLLTDQEHHNLLIPHVGPGKKANFKGNPDDSGRFMRTAQLNDAYRFRTPPLRNVTETGPYMHNGVYTSLEKAVRHHLDIVVSFTDYNPMKNLKQFEAISPWDPEFIAATIPGDLPPLDKKLSKKKIKYLLKFLKSLTAPDLHKRLEATIPESVPSGLPLDIVIPDKKSKSKKDDDDDDDGKKKKKKKSKDDDDD